MEDKRMKRCLAVGIILLFVGTCIIPAIAQETDKPLPTSKGDWLYVGGSGPGNYSKIQDAIDNASDGDMVFVYSGYYNENIRINKSIDVSGQDRNTTFILGRDLPYISYVFIVVPNVKFKGFTIQMQQNSSNLNYGIGIIDCANSQIEKTCVKNFQVGIEISNSDLVTISNNTIQNCANGIVISSETKNVTIKNNIIESNRFGISVSEIKNKTIILRNTIKNNKVGIELLRASYTIVQENNLLQNKREARIDTSLFSVWERNYWNRPRVLPKVIFGMFFIYGLIGFPYINIDWHPTQKPYDIQMMS